MRLKRRSKEHATWLDVMKGYRDSDHPLAKVAAAWCRARKLGGGPRRRQMRREHVLEWAGRHAKDQRDELDRVYQQWVSEIMRSKSC